MFRKVASLSTKSAGQLSRRAFNANVQAPSAAIGAVVASFADNDYISQVIICSPSLPMKTSS
jgi:hypothetical protein